MTSQNLFLAIAVAAALTAAPRLAQAAAPGPIIREARMMDQTGSPEEIVAFLALGRAERLRRPDPSGECLPARQIRSCGGERLAHIADPAAQRWFIDQFRRLPDTDELEYLFWGHFFRGRL